MCLEGIVITEGSLLGITESRSDRITSNVGDGGLRVWNDLSTLDVEALDFSERTADELSDDGEDFSGVNGKTWAVERGVSHAVGVEITSVGIAGSGVSVSRIGTSASIAIAHGLRDGITGVGCNSRRNGVCFPDIHLGAAGAVASNTSVGVVSGWHPAGDITLTVDELEITRALGIAVPNTVFGTSLVCRESCHYTIFVHGHEVESTIETTRKV